MVPAIIATGFKSPFAKSVNRKIPTASCSCPPKSYRCQDEGIIQRNHRLALRLCRTAASAAAKDFPNDKEKHDHDE